MIRAYFQITVSCSTPKRQAAGAPPSLPSTPSCIVALRSNALCKSQYAIQRFGCNPFNGGTDLDQTYSNQPHGLLMLQSCTVAPPSPVLFYFRVQYWIWFIVARTGWKGDQCWSFAMRYTRYSNVQTPRIFLLILKAHFSHPLLKPARPHGCQRPSELTPTTMIFQRE